MDTTPHIGKAYRSFDGMRRWELLYEDMYLVILETGIQARNDSNLVGISAKDLLVKWSLSGVLGSEEVYDGITDVWIRNGHVWTGTWSCWNRRIDPWTGKVLEEVFTK